MSEQTIGTVKLSKGRRITGRYKRSNRDAKVIKLSVDRCLVVPDRFGTPIPYAVGTRLDGAQAGMVMAMRADCFNPSTVDIADDDQFEPLTREGWYINPDADPMFGFFEHLEDAIDIELNLERGGKLADEFEVEALDIPALIEVADEPLEIVVDAETALMVLNLQATGEVPASEAGAA